VLLPHPVPPDSGPDGAGSELTLGEAALSLWARYALRLLGRDRRRSPGSPGSSCFTPDPPRKASVGKLEAIPRRIRMKVARV
jgi:hypothetical protein